MGQWKCCGVRGWSGVVLEGGSVECECVEFCSMRGLSDAV